MLLHPVPPHIPFMKILENQGYHQDFRGSGSSFKLFHQQITHSLKIAIALVKIYNFKAPTLYMVLRLRTQNLRAEFRKLLHFINQKRLFAMKGYFPRGIGIGSYLGSQDGDQVRGHLFRRCTGIDGPNLPWKLNDRLEP